LGIMSMAYGFQFSGVKSLVYSLWKVDETETNKLFDLFYSQIKKGVSKDVALYLAKIEYLKKAGPITANPRYWSGFVVSGNTSPFSFSPNYKLYIVGALAIIVLLILVIRYRKLLIR